MDQERLSLMALHFVPGIGPILVKQLIATFGSAIQVFKEPRGNLLRIPWLGKNAADTIRQRSAFRSAEAELSKAEKEGCQVVFYSDKAYPSRMRNIDDAPSLLYLKGNTNLNVPKSVAIVGTRKATGYGREQVGRIIEELVPHRPLIISGLAYGIDIQAHKQALHHRLQTVGVLGSGLDVIYPYAHREVAARMCDQGGLVTENPFGTTPDAHNFPPRNRIIAGMCDALIVVEAAVTGGALITAEIANGYSRDVFAVPGNLGNMYSEGCNKIIKINKASLFTSVSDLEYLMNWKSGDARTDHQLALDLSPFSDDEQAVLLALQEGKRNGIGIDDLSALTGFDQGRLASLLLSLEFRNVVSAVPGKIYKMRQ